MINKIGTDDYVQNDTRKFVIKTNPGKKLKFKVMRDSYRRELNGSAVKRQGQEGYQVQENEFNDLVMMPGVSVSFVPPRRPDNLRLLTGLDIEVDNPYSKEAYFRTEEFEKVLKSRPTAKLQHLLEYEHDVEFNYYTSNIDPMSSKKDSKKYFYNSNERFFKLSNNDIYLNMSIPRERVIYYALTARMPGATPTVARNFQEMEDNSFAAKCKWYFVDEEEKQSITKSKLEKRNTIIFGIETINKDKKTAIFDMVKALEISEAKDIKLTKERAYILLNEYAFSSNEASNLFNEYFDKWSDAHTRREIEAYALIFDLLAEDLIKMRHGKYEVVIKSKKLDSSEIKLYSTKIAFATEFIMDPVFKEQVEDLKVSLRAKRQ